jgi:DNA-binding transcriptional regulator YiaG
MFPLAAYAKNEKANLSRAERNAMNRPVPILATRYTARKQDAGVITKTVPKRAVEKVARIPKTRPSVGTRNYRRIGAGHRGTRGENDNVRVTLVHVPEVDVRKVRTKTGLSQAQFATKFGFPPATLRNWEQGRSNPDAPTRVLLQSSPSIQRL